MAFLLSLIPPVAWILIFLVLLVSFSYLYVYHRNWGKVVISSTLILVLIGGCSWAYHTADHSLKTGGVANYSSEVYKKQQSE
jgi:hypothetical protein